MKKQVFASPGARVNWQLIPSGAGFTAPILNLFVTSVRETSNFSAFVRPWFFTATVIPYANTLFQRPYCQTISETTKSAGGATLIGAVGPPSRIAKDCTICS